MKKSDFISYKLCKRSNSTLCKINLQNGIRRHFIEIIKKKSFFKVHSINDAHNLVPLFEHLK